MCRVSTRDDLKLMDVGAGKAAMSKVVPGFPATVRYCVFKMFTFSLSCNVCSHCNMTSCLCPWFDTQVADFVLDTDLSQKHCIGAADCCRHLRMLSSAVMDNSCRENVPALSDNAAGPACPQLHCNACLMQRRPALVEVSSELQKKLISQYPQ